jgi:hypothetical protein
MTTSSASLPDSDQSPPTELAGANSLQVGDSVERAEAEAEDSGAAPTGPSVIDDWVVYPSMAFGILVTTALPIFLGQRICLPVLSAAVLIPMFIWALRLGRPAKAIQLGLFWAVVQSAVVVVVSILLSENASRAVAGGLDFRSDWLAWIASGAQVGHTPAMALGRASLELIVYGVAMAATGSVAGLIGLAVAMDAFNFGAATLLAEAVRPVLALLGAWPVWVIARLAGALVVGAVLAEPVANFNLRPAFLAIWWRDRKRLLVIGLGLLALSLVLQLLLAPLYRMLLQAALGLDS